MSKVTMKEKELEVSVRYKPSDFPGDFTVDIRIKGDIVKVRSFLKGFSI